ncbi:conjugal transfer protein TraH [Acinetobacter sp. P1(2025)]|uniref:conjugal transfer protein TraH n=1 Tax=Acinetobacter sp. P1(2025) TaxID=3446120 RepID=UPI003F5296BD
MKDVTEFKLGAIPSQVRSMRIGALLATVVGLSSQVGVGNAGFLDDFMGDMYTNTTGAGYFSAQQRGVVSGGSFVGRVPIKPINIASLDIPRASAGCGGINLFGGSFSFINAKELTALLRAVAQNALGLLFQLGINAISQPLSSMLSVWSNKLQQMNAALKNSCEAARKIFQIASSGDMMGSLTESFKQLKGTENGDDEDYFTGVARRWKTGWAALTGKENGTNETRTDKEVKKNPYYGNPAYRAMVANRNEKAIIPDGQEEDEQTKFEARMLIMNLTGTTVYENEQPLDDKCEGGAGACEPKTKTYDSVLKFNDLIAPDKNDDRYFYCAKDNGFQTDDENACNKLVSTKLSAFYKGIRANLNKVFYNIDSPDEQPIESILAQISNGRNNGIIGKSMVANSTLNEGELRFSMNDPFSIPTYIAPLAAQPYMAATLSEKLRMVTERTQAIKLGEAVLSASKGLYNGTNISTVKPQNYDANIKAFEDALNTYRNQPPLEFDISNSLQMYATLMRASIEASSLPISPYAGAAR